MPKPDLPSGRWSGDLVQEIRVGLAELIPQLDALRALGAVQIAETLRRASGIENVTASAVKMPAERGLLRRLGEFNEHPLYGALEAEQWSDITRLAGIVGKRKAWIEASMSTQAAAEQCGWSEEEFLWAAAQRELSTGRLGRGTGRTSRRWSATWNSLRRWKCAGC